MDVNVSSAHRSNVMRCVSRVGCRLTVRFEEGITIMIIHTFEIKFLFCHFYHTTLPKVKQQIHIYHFQNFTRTRKLVHSKLFSKNVTNNKKKKIKYFIFISNKIDEKNHHKDYAIFIYFTLFIQNPKPKKKKIPKLIIISFRDIGDPCTHITSPILHITANVY